LMRSLRQSISRSISARISLMTLDIPKELLTLEQITQMVRIGLKESLVNQKKK
jgi:hypothetical protein